MAGPAAVRGSRLRAGSAAPIRSSIASRERTADQLHADRQLFVREACRDRERRQAEVVHRPRESGQPLNDRFGIGAVADVAFDDGRRRHRCGRREHGIEALDGGEVLGECCAAPAHRFEVSHGWDRQPVLQAHQHLRPIFLRPFDHPRLVECRGLDGEHDLAGAGEAALLGQRDPGDGCAFATTRLRSRCRGPVRLPGPGRRHRRRRARRFSILQDLPWSRQGNRARRRRRRSDLRDRCRPSRRAAARNLPPCAPAVRRCRATVRAALRRRG